MRVLITSPVRRKPAILRAFLRGLWEVDYSGMDADFCFVDDNDDPDAQAMLRSWHPPVGQYDVVVPQGVSEQAYDSANDFHRWGPELCLRVAAWRNYLAQRAMDGGYDAMLMVDSDLILHPQTLAAMAGAERHIVYEVFWTRFYPDQHWHVPNVWLWGECGQYRVSPTEEKLDATQIKQRTREWFRDLRKPGLYPVGGGGACTWISRDALLAGVDWRPVTNTGWWGEDRWFQTRAAVLGFEQWAQTSHPPIHLYRESDLKALPLRRAQQLREVAANV